MQALLLPKVLSAVEPALSSPGLALQPPEPLVHCHWVSEEAVHSHQYSAEPMEVAPLAYVGPTFLPHNTRAPSAALCEQFRTLRESSKQLERY